MGETVTQPWITEDFTPSLSKYEEMISIPLISKPKQTIKIHEKQKENHHP
jgi:hypothetical protein